MPLPTGLQQLLIKYGSDHYHMEYMKFRVNHAAHGILSILGIGGSLQQATEFAAHYATKLEAPRPIDPSLCVDSSNWMDLRGQHRSYRELVNFFKRELEEDCPDADAGESDELRAARLNRVLGRYLPSLLGGVVGAAFHGLIHMGYGVWNAKGAVSCASSLQLLAEGMAYATFVYKPLPAPSHYPTTSNRPPRELVDILDAIRTDHRIDEALTHETDELYKTLDFYHPKGFQLMVHVVANHAPALLWEYAEGLIDLSAVDTNPLAWQTAVHDVFDTCARLYCHSAVQNDFFLLHCVTSAWGLQQVLEWCPASARRDALASFCTALVAAYIARGRPSMCDPRDASNAEKAAPSWHEITEHALKVSTTEDEHKVKMVFVCKEAAQIRPEHDGLYRAAAWLPYNKEEFVFGVEGDD